MIAQSDAMPIKEIFANDLRSHQYIEARGLSPQVVAVNQSTRSQAEELPRIQRIVNSWSVPDFWAPP